MQSAYTYSATRARTLATELLQPADIERLLAAETNEDIVRALQESYLVPYVAAISEMAWQIDDILVAQQTEAVRLMMEIAPDPQIFTGFLARYDFHNIRIVAKAAIAGLDDAAIKQELSTLGWFAPDTMYSSVTSDTLFWLAPEFDNGYKQACAHLAVHAIDEAERALDAAYWAYRRRTALESADPLLLQLVAMEIDLYNASNRLRAEIVEQLDFSRVYQSGGTFSIESYVSVEATYDIVVSYGGSEIWQGPIELYQQGDSSGIERAIRANVRSSIHTASYDVLCGASLLDYLALTEMANDIVRIIVIGKQSGQDSQTIRQQLIGFSV